jgi:hypothetical protein
LRALRAFRPSGSNIACYAGAATILAVPHPLLEGAEAALEIGHNVLDGVIRQRRRAEADQGGR